MRKSNGLISIRVSKNRLAKDFQKYASYIKKQSVEFTEDIANQIAESAYDGFMDAPYDGSKDDIWVEPQKLGNGGWNVVATGEGVLPIEYGSGVYNKNTDSEHWWYTGSVDDSSPPATGKPAQVRKVDRDAGAIATDIGEARTYHYEEKANSVYTHGCPASAPMWKALKEALDNMSETANEYYSERALSKAVGGKDESGFEW